MSLSRRLRPVVAAVAFTPLFLVASRPAVGAQSPVQAPAPRPAVSAPTRTDAPDDTVRMAESVAREVEQLRGWTFKRPVKKARATRDAARAYMTASIARSMPGSRKATLEAFLSTAGLIPPGTDITTAMLALLEDQVAGYYDPDTSALYVVERGDMPALMQRVVLAHELTHALDDQYADLRSLSRPDDSRTEDQEVVLSSLQEGSATALMFQYMAAAQRAGNVNLAELSQYVAREMAKAQALETMPRYFSAILGSYTVGAAFLSGGDLTNLLLKEPDNRGVGDRFLAARRALPRSGEQVLHPEKYWNPAQPDDPVLVDDQSAERWLAAPGRFVVHRNTLGELLTAVLTEPAAKQMTLAAMQSSAAWTNAGAAGWGGDRFFLLASGQAADEAARSLTGLRAVWVTAWDSPADRDEFVTALAAGHPPVGATTVPLGSLAAVVFIGFDAAERQALMARLPDAPLAFTRGGKPWQY